MVSVTESGVKRLTTREKEILGLVQKGTHHAAVAEQLGISLGTVRNHISNIYGKCGGIPMWANPLAWLAVNADRISQEIGDSTP